MTQWTVLFAVVTTTLVAGCGGGSAGDGTGGDDLATPDAAPGTGPDARASGCDDGTDQVCPGTECTSDPDCTPRPDAPPGCVPPEHPAPPTDMMTGVQGLVTPGAVAALDGRVYALAMFNASPANTHVIDCPATGCPAQPHSFGDVHTQRDRAFVAAADGNIFWSEDTNSDEYADRVMRAGPQGTSPAAVVSGNTVTYSTTVSPVVDVAEAVLLVDVSETSGTSSGPHAGVRGINSTVVSTPIPGIRTPKYATSAVAGSIDRLAYFADPIGADAGFADSRIHVLDLDGVAKSVSTTRFYSVSRMAIVGGTLLVHGTTDASVHGLFACPLASCTTLTNVGAAVRATGFTFAVDAGRVYFSASVDAGCGQGFDGVLASCTAASLMAGTCTPTLHSRSFHWVNATSIAVSDGVAYMTSKTASQSLFKATL